MDSEEVNVVYYKDVKNQTTEEYFKGNKFSIDAFNKKYAQYEGETYVQAMWRVCTSIAATEKTLTLRTYWAERWFDEIYNDWWKPGGSIVQGAGSGKKISVSNCTHISMGILHPEHEWDNLESIIQNTTFTVAKCAAYRQGLGVAFDRLRPETSTVMNSSKISSGAIHWMKFIDSLGMYVGQNGRIPAMLFSLNIKHPDIESFITVKSNKEIIQNANISVQITNDFYKAVENGKNWELKFEIPGVNKGDKVYLDIHSTNKDTKEDKNGFYKLASHTRKKEVISRKVDASKLLMLLVKNMFENAEPGIQNIDIARKYSNSDYLYDPRLDYDTRIEGSNACSEQYLSRDSLCVLASLNYGKLSIIEDIYIKQLSVIGPSINRFLDNVNEYELAMKTYATPFQKMAIQALRRTGAGFTNADAWLFKNGTEYGSIKGNEALEELTRVYNYYLYDSSIKLGKEKGSFGAFNREKYEQSPFIKRMMKEGLEFTHMRNVTCSSIAPTGTLSLMFRDMVFSYGIEPAFYLYNWKRTRISGFYEYYFCVPSIVREVFKEKGFEIPMESDTIKDTWDGSKGIPIVYFIEQHMKEVGVSFKKATEISPFDKLDLMSRIMKWVDSSISVTYMFDPDTKIKTIYDFVLEAYRKEVKSIAAFPDKLMYGIVSFSPFKDLALSILNKGEKIHKQNFTDEERDQLASLGHEEEGRIIKTKAPKRPNDLRCEIHHFVIKRQMFYVVVGLMREDPYEIFTGINYDDEGLPFLPKGITHGRIHKEKRGLYSLVITKEGKDVSYPMVDSHSDTTANALTRILSTSLRHGADISFVVHQLEKTKGEMNSFARAVSRALKTYIREGTKVHGESCPSCGGIPYREGGGCIKCSCGWEKCS